MQYLSIRQMAEKRGIFPRRIQILYTEDRIPGAISIRNNGEYRNLQRNRVTQELKVGST